MGDLTRDFSKSEFRCHCGCGGDLVDGMLVDALQRLRDRLGRPINILSGYRCPKHNAATKGSVPDSQHVLGRAADVTVMGMNPEEVAEAAKDIPEFQEGGIGVYDTFTHLDVRVTGLARWDNRKEGKSYA
jgi:uncharacterized protein YcbK (DUF882 family)